MFSQSYIFNFCIYLNAFFSSLFFYGVSLTFSCCNFFSYLLPGEDTSPVLRILVINRHSAKSDNIGYVRNKGGTVQPICNDFTYFLSLLLLS